MTITFVVWMCILLLFRLNSKILATQYEKITLFQGRIIHH